MFASGEATDLPSITRDDLKPGDVLMSLDSWEVSQLIAAIEEGRYSHAAYWDGQSIIHGTREGVARAPLESFASKCHVDVLRMKPRDGHALGSPGLPVEPVSAAAEKLIGLPYDYRNLIMVAYLVWNKSHRTGGEWARLLRVLGKEALRELLGKLIEEMRKLTASMSPTPSGDVPDKMTCTEVVATAFWNADPQRRRYGLRIVIPRSREEYAAVPGPGEGLSAEDAEWLNELRQQSERLLQAVDPEIREKLAARRGLLQTVGASFEADAGSRELPLGLISPKEMATSPSFDEIGRLYPKPEA
jgi:hypothetical protein